MAEVGKPGSTTTGLVPMTARQSGLPGFSATPCTRMPGSPRRATALYETSPAPLEVPPDRMTRSVCSRAWRSVSSSAASSSGTMPSGTGSPPSSSSGRRDRGGVAVVHRARANRSARRDDLVAGGEHRDPRPAPDLDAGTTDRREHADLARGQQLAPPEHGLAARQIAPGEGDQLARHRRPHHANGSGRIVEIGMLDHQHRVGATRNHAAGRDHGRSTGQDGQAGGHPRRQHLGIEREDARLGRGRARRIGGAQREAVDVGSIEARHIDSGDDVVSEDPTDGLAERHAFLAERRQLEVAMKAGDRLVPIDHLEKLLLLRRASDRARKTVRLGFRPAGRDLPPGLNHGRGCRRCPARTARPEAPSLPESPRSQPG